MPLWELLFQADLTNAVAAWETITREGITKEILYQWTMIYNPGENCDPSWGFAFTFGDPHAETTPASFVAVSQ